MSLDWMSKNKKPSTRLKVFKPLLEMDRRIQNGTCVTRWLIEKWTPVALRHHNWFSIQSQNI